jgi:hypothetical protein
MFRLVLLALAGTLLVSCATVKEAGSATVNAVKNIPTPFGEETEEYKARKQEKEARRAERKRQYEERKAQRRESIQERKDAAEKGEVFSFVNPLYALYPFKPQEGDASNNQVLRERAWANVIDRTKVRLIDEDRMRIDMKSAYIMSVDDMEYVLLARAAGEAARAGKDSFSIVYVKYSGGKNVFDMLMPSFSYSDAEWIGTYEDLIRERENQRLTGGLGKIGRKHMAAVVYFTDKADAKHRDTFSATPLYLNMLNERLFNGKYPYDEKS